MTSLAPVLLLSRRRIGLIRRIRRIRRRRRGAEPCQEKAARAVDRRAPQKVCGQRPPPRHRQGRAHDRLGAHGRVNRSTNIFYYDLVGVSLGVFHRSMHGLEPCSSGVFVCLRPMRLLEDQLVVIQAFPERLP